MAECYGKRGEQLDFQTFFISIGARYKRIRKRPRGVPSPQLYAYKTEKLQELEQLERDGKINLYFADESHVCTEGYVPYGWQFRDEDVYVPSLKAHRINIFGMIDRNAMTDSVPLKALMGTRSLNFLMHSRSRLIRTHLLFLIMPVSTGIVK